MNKRLKNSISFFILSIYLIGASANEDIIELVMDAKSREELYSTNNPTMDDRRYVWSISEVLLDMILDNSNNDHAWNALHRFREFTDGGITTIYNDACFAAIKIKPLLFYERYIAGDEQALERAIDAVWGTDNYKDDREKILKTNVDILRRSAQLIREMTSDNKRHQIFIDSYEREIMEMIKGVNHKTNGSN